TLTVTNAFTTTFSGVLSGGGSSTVAIPFSPGSSTVVLANANTYTGTTTVSSGKLVVNTSTSLGTGPLVLGSDTPQPGSSLAAGANFITLANPFTVAAQGSTINGNNTFILAGKGTLNGTLTVSNVASTVGLTGGLSGSGGVTP